jgi:hypothetical protein
MPYGPAKRVERGLSLTAARRLARRDGVKAELRGLAERCELGQLAVRARSVERGLSQTAARRLARRGGVKAEL